MEIVVIGRNTPSFQSAVSGLKAKQHQVTPLVSMRQRHALESLKGHRTCDIVIAFAGSFVETDQAFAEAFQAEFRTKLVMLDGQAEVSMENLLQSIGVQTPPSTSEIPVTESAATAAAQAPPQRNGAWTTSEQWALDTIFECSEKFQRYVYAQLGRRLGELPDPPSSLPAGERLTVSRLPGPLQKPAGNSGQPPASKAVTLRQALDKIRFEDDRHFRLLSRLLQNKGKGEGGACLAKQLGFKNKEEVRTVFHELRALAARQCPDLQACFIAKRSYGYGLVFPED